MEVQTVEKKPNTGKQTVTATEETSSVAERTKEVIIRIQRNFTKNHTRRNSIGIL
jgi:hypothetical protein